MQKHSSGHYSIALVVGGWLLPLAMATGCSISGLGKIPPAAELLSPSGAAAEASLPSQTVQPRPAPRAQLASAQADDWTTPRQPAPSNTRVRSSCYS